MELHPEGWLRTVRQEYLQRFIRQGGSAVKFVVAEQAAIGELIHTQLTTMAAQEGFCSVHIDSADTKVHMTDRFFHQVARSVDWDELAYEFVAKLLRENGYALPEDRSQFSLSGVATLNERAEPLLRRDLNSWLERAIYQDPELCQEFKMAMIRLCLAQLEPGEASPFLTTAVNQWLKGELRQLSALKDALIFQKIVRHNARHMFASLARWLRLAGKQGLVLSLDIQRYLVGKRPEQPDGFYYSPSAVMDAYEMLRQFIDGTDEIEGLFVVVVAPPEFLTDARRGLNRYEALKLRIWDEVRARNHQNPLGALIRLSSAIDTSEDVSSSEEDERAELILVHGNVSHQRVIEALRSGVPNRDVVRALGSNQPEIEGKFRRLLPELATRIETNTMSKGLLVTGGFGAGKSHLLESLQDIALEQNVVCSPIVISKETPFYNVVTLFRAAVDSAIVPQRRGHAVTEIAAQLNFQSPQYSDFYGWAQRQSAELDSRFGATLYLYEQMVNDPELSHRMIRFWAGDPVSNGELKKYLQGCSTPASYVFDKISAQDLAVQRFRFLSRLVVAAGYAGWILLIDEAEIIARYSYKQRVKSYAELARWMGALEASRFPGLGAVVALTDDFQTVVFDDKGDREKVLASLEQADTETARQLGRDGQQGIQVVDAERTHLSLPYEQLVEETYEKVRGIHASAYGWEPPAVTSVEQLSSTRMREYVRGWITEWDLKRIAPGTDVEIEVTQVQQDYSEDAELETAIEDEVSESKESSETDPLLAVALQNQAVEPLVEHS